MPSPSASDLQHLFELAEHHWRTPSPHWSHGGDPRSTDAALLVLFHGGLVSAARHDWLNAGRRLIDKTYIAILLHARGLATLRAVSPEQVAAALDNHFIPRHIAPRWATFAELQGRARLDGAIELVEVAAAELFGSLHSEVVASQLLFYLLPQLPVFPYSRDHAAALATLDGVEPARCYSDYARRCASMFNIAADQFRQPPPAADYGSHRERAACDEILLHSDWWPRRLYEFWLQQCLPAGAFGCNGEGR